jgi:hypothetical protein
MNRSDITAFAAELLTAEAAVRAQTVAAAREARQH